MCVRRAHCFGYGELHSQMSCLERDLREIIQLCRHMTTSSPEGHMHLLQQLEERSMHNARRLSTTITRATIKT